IGRCPMTIPFALLLRFCFLASLICALQVWTQQIARADPVPVRQVEGSIHGLVEMRAEDGHVIASGDITRVVQGGHITSRLVFHFRDGSIDDETTVFSAHRSLLLITEHLDLPPDLANGMIPVLVENLRPEAPTTLSMVVTTPKPRLVKLVISGVGEDRYSLAGSARKAIHYEIKIDLGGVAGLVAPLIGKAPPHIEIWTIGGAATTFAREQGPLYPEGPMVTIQLASPKWPAGPAAGR